MKKYWTMKTGEKISIKKMSDTHLKNTILMLERNAKRIHKSELDACMSISFEGEQAQLEQDRFLQFSDSEDYLPEVYDSLYDEAIKRGLSNFSSL